MKRFRYFFIACWGLILFVFPASGLARLEPMPVDSAFQLSTSVNEDHVVRVHFTIAPEHYLYANKLQFKIKRPKQVVFGRILMPKAEEKKDIFFGEQKIYKNSVDISLPVLNWDSGHLKLQVHYQGCSDQGYCYPPIDRWITLNDQAQTQTQSIRSEGVADGYANVALTWLNQQPLWLIPLGFIGFGLLLSLTPCTFPMIPILSSIILGFKGQLNTTKAFFLSLTYVVSMSFVYALMGVLAGFLGSNFQILFQKTWVIALFSVLLILLALCSLMGFYKLKMPVLFEKSLLALSHKQKKGTYLGVAIMGALSTLIVSPCVTAPLVGVISFISQTGKAGLGGMALFFMGLGMGIPLLLIGTLEGRWLPKSSQWTRSIEIILGFLLLGVSLTLLKKILPAHFILSLWGALIWMAAFYMGDFFNEQAGTLKPIRKSFSIVLGVYGASLMVGGLMGNEAFLSPLKRVHRSSTASRVAFEVVSTVQSLDKALTQARRHHQFVLLDFYADWCAYCKIQDKTLFQDPEVFEKIKNFKCIKVDITQVNEESKVLMVRYQVIAPPVLLLLSPVGKEIKNRRWVGEINKASFLRQLEAAGL